MRYTGYIKELNKIIISDLSYDKEVGCRYARDKLNKKDWTIDIEIREVEDKINDDLSLKGKELFILLQPPEGKSILREKGGVLYNLKKSYLKVKKKRKLVMRR